MRKLALIILSLSILNHSIFASGTGKRFHAEARFHGLVIHLDKPGERTRGFYQYKFDDKGIVVFTPGFTVSLDQPLPFNIFSYVRYMINFNLDCALKPAGFAGAMIMLKGLGGDFFTFRFGIGAGIYIRESWKDLRVHTAFVWDADKIQWVIAPYPEIELSFHPQNKSIEFTINVMSIVAITMLNAGIRFPISKRIK